MVDDLEQDVQDIVVEIEQKSKWWLWVTIIAIILLAGGAMGAIVAKGQ